MPRSRVLPDRCPPCPSQLHHPHVAQVRRRKVRALPGPLPRHGEEPRGERLAQPEGHDGRVAEERRHRGGVRVARDRDAVQPQAADAGVREEVVHAHGRLLSRAPLGQAGVLQGREHEAGVAHELQVQRLERRGQHAADGERARGAEAAEAEALERRDERDDVRRGRHGRVDAGVRDWERLSQRPSEGLQRLHLTLKHGLHMVARCEQVAGAAGRGRLERLRHEVGRLAPDGERRAAAARKRRRGVARGEEGDPWATVERRAEVEVAEPRLRLPADLHHGPRRGVCHLHVRNHAVHCRHGGAARDVAVSGGDLRYPLDRGDAARRADVEEAEAEAGADL
mmetsp:Transcript_6153/g.18428  ORF Transcript_6153/g.18428 Transcript_6153/m.18428 type:complete len:339 (-) Transcript_6153:273-1289(-)